MRRSDVRRAGVEFLAAQCDPSLPPGIVAEYQSVRLLAALTDEPPLALAASVLRAARAAKRERAREWLAAQKEKKGQQ